MNLANEYQKKNLTTRNPNNDIINNGSRPKNFNGDNLGVKQYLELLFLNIYRNIYNSEYNGETFSVSYPPKGCAGDVATNASFCISKITKEPPFIVAAMFTEILKDDSNISSIEIAKNGFINITFTKQFWLNQVLSIENNGEKALELNIGNNEAYNIEFCSANPTGPLHIGHARGTIYGDAMANIFKSCSYNIKREYYINDYGKQVHVLAESLFLRYRECLGESITIPEKCYPGEYLIPIAEELVKEYGDSLLHMDDLTREDLLKNFSVNSIMNNIKYDLDSLGISFDIFSSEKELVNSHAVEDMINLLSKKGLVYTGEVLEGHSQKIQRGKDALIFKSKQFGDTEDRVLVRSDGSLTYFASDLAYHYNKFLRGFNLQFDVMGADHAGYVKRLSSGLNVLSDGDTHLDIAIMQMVSLSNDGTSSRMSKRAGNFVLVRDLLSELSVGELRYFLLSRSQNSQLSINIDELKKKSLDNPIYYIQYANARIHAILKKYHEMDIDESSFYKYKSSLLDEQQIKIIKKLSFWPDTLSTACRTKNPQVIAQYAYELAEAFHFYYSLGKNSQTMRIINDADLEKTRLNILVLKNLKITLDYALQLLGITPIDEM